MLSTNGKKKGENNKKNGNKYLAWAYVEAANFMKRYCPQKKLASTQGVQSKSDRSNKSIKQQGRESVLLYHKGPDRF